MDLRELFLGAFLGGFFNVLLDRLTSPELVQFLSQEGFETKIKSWEDTLKTINALLGDAEKKQLTTDAVKKWLKDLEELAYDVEEMFDEFEYEATARKMKMDQIPESSTFWKHVPTGFCNWSLDAISFRSRMWSKVNDVTTRFDKLCELRRKLGLQVNTEGTSSTSSISSAAPQRPPTSSLPTGAVYGRGEDQEKILGMVLKNEPNDSNILVIPIVGMGGVGKTTLAREVYNHEAVESFEVKAWVCVSDGGFDVTRISMSILKDITKSAEDNKDFNTVQNDLKQKTEGKKFLLVLDDVWKIESYGDWEILLSPFMQSALGSRIIVTTRDKLIALKLRPSGFHHLDLLQREDCWLVFAMCAFENGTIPAHDNIQLIREKIIEKCKGLPLAAKTLGSFLRSEQIGRWLEILNNKLWDEKDGSMIPAALKLSFYHLPSHLRRCFAYCSIFPKGYEFKIEEVVCLWIAEGLVQQSIKNKQPEDLGCEYFSDLLGRSMFQSNDNNGHTFVMHDLVHDLAEWAFEKRSFRLDGESSTNLQPGGLKNVRHFSYISDRYDGKGKFAVFLRAKDLKARTRTFLPIQQDNHKRYVTDLVPFALLPELKKLRVLSLQSYCITKVPILIGGLKHLRYLNLSGTMIRSLPESTCLLFNLQILMLRDCYRLEKLPSNFKYLIKLRHLDIKNAVLIKEMPLGMKYLKNLQKLSNFIVGEDVGSSLKDLMSLRMLRGKLCIEKLDNVIDCNHKDLILRDKKGLEELLLQWGSQFHDSRSEAIAEKVLDMLQPNENLQELTITCYGGTKFPSWVGAPSYSNMKVLRLKNCVKCSYLPSLGVLDVLEDLTIEGMEEITHIGFNFYGKGHSKPFKSLKTLHFEDLPKWEVWEPIEENEYGDAFPCLKKLSIKACPQLSGSLPKSLSALEEFIVINCEQLVVSFSNIPKLCKIHGCKTIACDKLVDFKSVRDLELSNISEFSNQLMQECFGKAHLQQIEHKSAEIYPEKPPVGGLQSVGFITKLVISNCSNIVSFSEVCFLPHLSMLLIVSCDSLAFIVGGQLPPSLKWLRVSGCKKLESLWDDRKGSCSSMQGKEDGNSTNSSLLVFLSVWNCPSLRSLSSIIQLPTTLKHLDFRQCPQLTQLSQSGQLPTSLKQIFFRQCDKLSRFLDSNTSLEAIGICHCENLQIPNGLHKLGHLRELSICCCPTIDCFPEEGLADTNLRKLRIKDCQNLKALPIGLSSLNSLEDLTIWNCPIMTSFNPEEEFPTNLKVLQIEGCVNVYRPLVKWGLHNLTSLTSLCISECPDVESFPQQEMEMMLPPSLTQLGISRFPELKQLWSQGFQNLTSLHSLTIQFCPYLTSLGDQRLPSSLESLEIRDCPDLTSLGDQGLPSSLHNLQIWNCRQLTCFPNQGLPSSLHTLKISWCPKLTEECKRNKSKISNILEVIIDDRNFFEIEEDEDEEAQSSSWYRFGLASTNDDILDGSSIVDDSENNRVKEARCKICVTLVRLNTTYFLREIEGNEIMDPPQRAFVAFPWLYG